jgi:hypothetical protein
VNGCVPHVSRRIQKKFKKNLDVSGFVLLVYVLRVYKEQSSRAREQRRKKRTFKSKRNNVYISQKKKHCFITLNISSILHNPKRFSLFYTNGRCR